MSTFEEEFLKHYLAYGLGSMPKSDIDALVMYLLDTYGRSGSGPMAGFSNQTVSETLKAPVSKVKKLRYEAALKFGGRAEDQAKARLLAALSKASLEPDGDKICLVLEDSLAKHWLQGQLKLHQQVFDHSFNSEIVKVSFSGLLSVLATLFGKKEFEAFKKGYESAIAKKTNEERTKAFKSVAMAFAQGAAKTAGASVPAILKALLSGI